jgi:hypothetical protein
MKNGQKPSFNDVVPVPEELPSQQLTTVQGGSLEGPSDDASIRGSRRPTGRIVGISLLGISIIAGVLLALHVVNANKQQAALNANQSDQSVHIKSQAIGLSSLGLKPINPLTQASNTLTVNGSVNIADSLVLNPTPTPKSATAGQLYFDQQKNQLGYYNGSSFTYLQGGGGTQVANYYTSNVTNNNVTNVTGSSTPNSSVTAPAGTVGDIAMFTASNTLGNSLLSESGSTVNVGGSTINIGSSGAVTDTTVGTLNNNSTLALQGGTGGATFLTGNTSGTSGSIDIASGDSSTTSAGNVTIDTGSSFVTGLVIKDDTFETSMLFTTYTYGAETVNQDCTVAHSGSCSMNITGWGAGGGSIVNAQEQSDFSITPGHQYFFSGYVKAATTSAQIIFGPAWAWPGCGAANFYDNTASWTHVTFTCVAPAGDYNAWLLAGFNSPTTETHYFDDLTVTDLNQSTTTAVLNLGTTNAQEVNIGNANNQLDATSIYGDGINLSAGHGNIDATGATADISASGTGNFTATGGALTLSGAGGSGSGVIVMPQTDSTTAFQVQNSTGTALLNANTTDSVITSAGNFIVNTPSSCNYNTYGTYLAALSPSSYWKLEDSGTTAADSSGNNNTGTLSNVTTGITPGPIACASTHPAMSFNAANNSRITTTNAAASPNAYTQVVMFKSTTPAGTFIGYTDGVGNHDREFGINNNGQLYSRIYNSSLGDETITSSSAVDDGNWHIAVATVSNAGMYLYLDGTLVAANPSYNSPQSYTGTWLLGGEWGVSGAPYNGELAQVATFPSALNALQAQTLSADSGFYTANLAAIGIGTTTPAANLDDAGSALFHDVNNSTAAFQVQNSSGTNLFDVDTSNSAVNIGTSGADTVNLGSATGTMGFTSVGPTQDSGDMNLIAGGQYTAPYTGTIGSLSAYVGNNVDIAPYNQIQLAIYADNGSNAPGAYIASTAVGTETANSLVTLPISAAVTAGTKYWLVKWTNTANNSDDSLVNTTVTGQSHYYAWTSGVTFGSGADNGMPATFPGPSSDNNTANFQTFYASYAASTGPALTVNTIGTLTDNGAAIFEDATSSTTAFQIQNSSGTALFTADTADMLLTVASLTVNATLTVGGHIVSTGTVPTIAAGSAACTSPTVGVVGTDTTGTITVTTGTGCSTSGTLATITFANAFGATPFVTLTPGDPTALGLGAYTNDGTASATSFSIGTNTTPANSTTYEWNYQVIQ